MGYLIIFPFKLLFHSLIGLKYIAFQVITSSLLFFFFSFFIFHLSSLTSYWIVWFSYFTSKYFFYSFFSSVMKLQKKFDFTDHLADFISAELLIFFNFLISQKSSQFHSVQKRIRKIFVEFLRTSIALFKGTTMIAINVAFWLIKIIIFLYTKPSHVA